MARVRPFKPMQFADHVLDAGDRLWTVISSPRQPGDRSKYVRFARAAAKMAAWLRDGDLVIACEASFPSVEAPKGLGRMALVEVEDVIQTVEVKPSEMDDHVRLLEATNCHLWAQTCVVEGDDSWLGDLTQVLARRVLAVGGQLQLAAAREFAGGRSGKARSQLLVNLFPSTSLDVHLMANADSGRERDLKLQLAEKWGIEPILSGEVSDSSSVGASELGTNASPSLSRASLVLFDLVAIANSGKLLPSNALRPVSVPGFIMWSLREFEA